MAVARRIGSVSAAVKGMDKGVRLAIDDTFFTGSKTTLKYLTSIVAPWRHKPVFKARRDETEARLIRWLILVTGAPESISIWEWIDRGTGMDGPKGRRYPILPVNYPVLVFRRNYSARTAPIAKFNVGTGVSTGARVISLGVMHPGIRKRLFVTTHADEMVTELTFDLRTRLAALNKR